MGSEQYCIKNAPGTDSRVKMLQTAWSTGDTDGGNVIDREKRINEIIRGKARSSVFLAATILLSCAMAPVLVAAIMSCIFWNIPPRYYIPEIIIAFCPSICTLVGLWMILSQARKGEGQISLGMNFLLIGQYLNLGLHLLGAVVLCGALVHACAKIGAEYANIQNTLFWCTFIALGAIVLVTYLYWKLVAAIKVIRDVREGIRADGFISATPGLVSIAYGAALCLSVVGVLHGLSMILFGIVLMSYRRAFAELEGEILETGSGEAVRREIMPTWKKVKMGEE